MKRRRTLFNVEAFLRRRDIKENSIYLVNVSYSGGNPIHPAILFIGFKTGAYCELYINNYDAPVDLHRVYYLEVVSKLCNKIGRAHV